MFAQLFVGCAVSRGKRTQLPKHDRIIRMAALEEAQEIANELVVFCLAQLTNPNFVRMSFKYSCSNRG